MEMAHMRIAGWPLLTRSMCRKLSRTCRGVWAWGGGAGLHWKAGAAPEAVRRAVGGGCHSSWGWLLSVTNTVEAGTWHQEDSGWAWAGRPGGGGGGTSPPSSASLGVGAAQGSAALCSRAGPERGGGAEWRAANASHKAFPKARAVWRGQTPGPCPRPMAPPPLCPCRTAPQHCTTARGPRRGGTLEVTGDTERP